MSKKKALKWLAIFVVSVMLLPALITYIFDPFYQYHMPFFNLDASLYDRDNQVVGTIRTFDYDSVLLGSSVAENFDSSFLDNQYECTTLKISRASGSVADLLYYMDMAHEKQDIKNVFWCMDIFSMTASIEVTLYDASIPRYLHTETVLDDITYLYNKDILFKEIPLSIANSFLGRNTEGNAYNWAEDKTFSVEQAMKAYQKPDTVLSEAPISDEKSQLIEANISMVIEEITSHPDTEYTIIFPPYSLLWWDCGYTNGFANEYFYVLETLLPKLLECENATVYYFQAEKEIVCDLNYYMDMVHYSPEINQYMLDCVVNGENQVTVQNLDEVLNDMYSTFDYIIFEGIYEYYSK